MEEEQREQKEQAERKDTEQARQSGRSTTPYDDAWRTLTTAVPKLLIPMVNEVFGTHFTENAVVHLKQNEHMYSGMNGKTEKHITDTNFVIVDESLIDSILGSGFDIIEGEVAKHYVFECESKPVGPVVLVRIVEYSVKTAVESGTNKGKTKLTVHIPQTAILSLRSTANTPDEMQLEIVTESGSCSSTIRVMKLSNYNMESIFDKKLYLLLPFLLFNYEKRFDEIEESETDYDSLLELFRTAFSRVDELVPENVIPAGYVDLFTSKVLRATTHTVVNGLAGKHPKIQEGVNTVVGGNLIDYEVIKIWRDGKAEGIAEGEVNGEARGKASAYNDMAERLIRKGMHGSDIVDVTGYNRKEIDSIARRLNRTVTWSEARA